MNLNLVSFQFSDEEFTALKQKISDVLDKVNEFAIELHIEDKNSLQTLGNRSLAFTEYAFSQATQQKTLVPPYIDVEEFKKDLNLFKQTKDILQQIEILRERMMDTNVAAGADAYGTARKFYASVGAAAKSGIPGATVLHTEMKKRFRITPQPNNGTDSTKPPETKEPAAQSKETK